MNRKDETFVFLTQAHHVDSRKTCESIQGHKININIQDVPMPEREVIRAIYVQLTNIVSHEILHNAYIYSMNEYMDLFNNEEINSDEYFMSYISVTYTINY